MRFERLGPHNDRVNAARDLQQAKGRREQGRFILEGPTLLREALDSGVELLELFVSESVAGHNQDVAAAARAGATVGVIDERTVRKLSDLETPTGLLAVASRKLSPLPAVFSSGKTVLVLADINDPGNAGTLLRSAEAFGATAAVFGTLAVDPFHPKVVRSAMGSLFRLKIAVCDPEAFAAAARAAQATVVGLSAQGQSLRNADWPAPAAIVVGHERHGLGAWGDICNRLAAIPMAGVTESLNAAIAGSIALYEAAGRP